MKRKAIALLCLLGASAGFSVPALALTYKTTVGVDFTINPTLTVTLSDADLVIESLAPGTSANSNEITVTVTTNAAYGYSLTATTGSAANATRNLIPASGDALFTSIDFNSDSASYASSIADDNTWGYSIDHGTKYNGLPLYTDTENVVTLLSGTEMPTGGSDSTPFLIGAKASTTMTAGEYTNVINFAAVAQTSWVATEVDCPANYICYVPNADNGAIEGSMNYLSTYSGDRTSNKGYQSAGNNASVTLVAPNYKREGYGFAGWNTAYDYSGTTYGPMETITAPSTQSTKGLTLYAMWIESEGYIQNWTGCSDMTATTYDSSTGKLTVADNSITALTDKRDGNTYAVAKLADGNCWMIENLRLDSEYSSNKDLSQGFGTNATYGNFTGLPASEDANFSDTTTANSLYYSGTQSGTAVNNIGTSNYPGYRMPRYNNNNTNIGGTNASGTTLVPSYNANTAYAQWYSYGNYYTWSATLANTTYYSGPTATDSNNKTSETVNTSICPSGWRLPYGRNTGNGLANGGFSKLDSAMGGTGANQSSTAGTTQSKKWRAFPNNFLYSGNYYGSSALHRGVYGLYWSSSANSSSYAYNLYLVSSDLRPGTDSSNKFNGFTVRCVAGS